MNPSQIARQTLEEHRKLEREIEILRLRLQAPAESSISGWMERCEAHLQQFNTLLRRHMDMEESGGFMDVVRDRRPTLNTRIDALRDEHDTMRQMCAQIEALLGACSAPTSKDVEQVREQTEALLDKLHRHEDEENRLVQDVFTQDIGTGG